MTMIPNDLYLLRLKILHHSLPFIEQRGWDFSALIAGAEKAGIEPNTVKIAFDGREKEAVKAYSEWVDSQMCDQLLQKIEFQNMKVHQKIREAILTRLQILSPYKSVAQKTREFLKTPVHATFALHLIYKTVNDMWYAAGDTSTDHNFYTKRMILAGVYASTLTFWLKETSDDLTKVSIFLDKRLQDAAKIPRFKSKLSQGFDLLITPVKSFCKKAPKL